MPWEKSFDLDDATDKAAAVFWAKGYEATSISDLVAAMGINKGSLYNAFGDKRRLFI
ncbi:MAG: TetR/AcrR family transcriptional regulator, partial [Pikeienuella sp.]